MLMRPVLPGLGLGPRGRTLRAIALRVKFAWRFSLADSRSMITFASAPASAWLTSSKATLHLLLEIKLDSNWNWRGEFNAQVLTCAFGFWLHQFACICIFSRAMPNVCQASRLRPRLQPRPDQHWTLGRGPARLVCVCCNYSCAQQP